jgi:hypothetical protein
MHSILILPDIPYLKSSGYKTTPFIHKYLSDNFPIQNGLKLGDALSPMLFNFALEYGIRKAQKTRWD